MERKTSVKEELKKYSLFDRFQIERMTEEKFSEILRTILEAFDNILDLTSELADALDPFVGESAPDKFVMTPDAFDACQRLRLLERIAYRASSVMCYFYFLWDDGSGDSAIGRKEIVDAMNRIHKLQEKRDELNSGLETN